MYASSIFGWVRFLENRANTLRNETPVSESPIAEHHTVACRMGVLEFSELLEPLFGPISISEAHPEPDQEAIQDVIEEYQKNGVVRADSVPPATLKKVKTSPRFQVHGDFVIMHLNRVEDKVNIPPVLTGVLNGIERIVETIRDILKFLDADTELSPSLLARWKQIGQLLTDLHTACLRQLQRIHQSDQVQEEVGRFTNHSRSLAHTKPGFTND